MAEQIKLPGDRGGTSGPQKIKVFAAVPHNNDDGLLLSWEEEKPIFGPYVEMIGSMSLGDYDLDDPPSPGVWAFEGTLKVTSHKSNHPEDPEEWDTNLHWNGEWRPPNVDEQKAWAKRRPKLIGKIGPAPIEQVKPVVTTPWPNPAILKGKQGPISFSSGMIMRPDSDWCECGKHVSECCCGESHGSNHHPSGRAYDEEDYEQFDK